MGSSREEELPEIGVEALRPETLAALRDVMQSNSSGVKEDYRLSQFWYTDECADRLARAIQDVLPSVRIAVLSCPSLHAALCGRLRIVQSTNFEFDKRCGGTNFVWFDYRQDIDPTHKSSYDLVIIDPPYVSRDVLQVYLKHAAFLCSSAPPNVLAFTSVVNRDWLATHGFFLAKFKLSFVSKLSTPLRAFTNIRSLLFALGGYDASDD